MATVHMIDTLYELLARTVEYPTVDLCQQTRECVTGLRAQRPRATRAMKHFASFVSATPPAELEELFTATFDLRPVCFPYLGYQLFGETYKRGEFLAALSARYRACGFSAGAELPDHLGAVLRYLAVAHDEELVAEGVIPAVRKMIDQLEGNPYRDPMRAILAAVSG
jgi:nitrate reductase molybdenum cofactor assembly chaperone NarJ/NarW